LNSPLHSLVRFRVGDIIHPNPGQVLCKLYEGNPLHGEVIAVTNDGTQSANYLVVRVQGLDEPVIVPIAKTSPHLAKVPRRARTVKMGRNRTG
jgi:hypothetical protein